MKIKIFGLVLALLTALVPLQTADAAETLNGAGASFPYPLYSAWAYAYQKATGVRVNYQSIGSGGGQRQIVERTVDFGASDDPVAPAQLKKDTLLQFPAVIGAITPVVNLPGVKDGQLRLDAEALCRIFLGEIKRWDDARLTAMNPGLKLPGKEITVIHRADGSGTTAIFTHYLSETCNAWKTKTGEGKAVQWPAGIGGKGNEGVANYVKRTSHSIGYVEFAYAKQNKLASVSLKNRAGNFVEPSFASFENAAETAGFDANKDFHAWLTNAPGKNAWPIAGATFILLAKEKIDVNKKTIQFFDWAFEQGDDTARKLVYVPLPPALKNKIRAYWKSKGLSP
jgi:phosphate transport system substrate-binding protein